jgi:hypothetical protein
METFEFDELMKMTSEEMTDLQFLFWKAWIETPADSEEERRVVRVIRELAAYQAIAEALSEAIDIIGSLTEVHHLNMRERGNKFHPGEYKDCPSSICKSGREETAKLAAALQAADSKPGDVETDAQ